MEPIYQSPLVLFIESDTDTKQAVIHPAGDYQQLNVAIKRLEALVQHNQANHPVIIFHSGSDTHTPRVAKKEDEQRNDFLFNGIFTLSGASEENKMPTHALKIPALGQDNEITSIFSTDSFYSDSEIHARYLLDSVKTMIARMEKFYNDHPLHHNNRVKFRNAQYVENRQAFSFWDAKKPFGDFPLSKPLFDKIIQELDATEENYNLYVDLVTDWAEQYSMFSGPPRFYALEVGVFIDDTQVALLYGDCSSQELKQFSYDHDLADQFLQALFQPLSEQLAGGYEAFVQNRALKNQADEPMNDYWVENRPVVRDESETHTTGKKPTIH
jgi:hypothetical protein